MKFPACPAARSRTRPGRYGSLYSRVVPVIRQYLIPVSPRIGNGYQCEARRLRTWLTEYSAPAAAECAPVRGSFLRSRPSRPGAGGGQPRHKPPGAD